MSSGGEVPEPPKLKEGGERELNSSPTIAYKEKKNEGKDESNLPKSKKGRGKVKSNLPKPKKNEGKSRSNLPKSKDKGKDGSDLLKPKKDGGKDGSNLLKLGGKDKTEAAPGSEKPVGPTPEGEEAESKSRERNLGMKRRKMVLEMLKTILKQPVKTTAEMTRLIKFELV